MAPELVTAQRGLSADGDSIQVEKRARYLSALDQGHTGQLLDLQTLVAGAVERSLDLAAGGK